MNNGYVNNPFIIGFIGLPSIHITNAAVSDGNTNVGTKYLNIFSISSACVIPSIAYNTKFDTNNSNVNMNIGILPIIYRKPSKFIIVFLSFTASANLDVYSFIHCICPTVHLLLCDQLCANPVGCSSYTIASVDHPNLFPFNILCNENSMSSVSVTVFHPPFSFMISKLTINPVPFNNGDSPKLYLAK